MTPPQKYLIWLLLFSLASVSSQYGSAIPFSLGQWFGVDVWVPFSALSTIPLLDVSRSFVQHYAEQAEVAFYKSLWHMLLIPTAAALVCSLTAGLPFTIFLGALIAVNVGGYIDIRVFRCVKFISRKPHIRMRFSNAAATICGTAAFFTIAFTGWPTRLGFADNALTKPVSVLLVGGIAQVIIIWITGIVIARFMAEVISRLERQEARVHLDSQIIGDPDDLLDD